MNKKGFTIIELLVAMVIAGIVSTLTINLFVRLVRSYQLEKVVSVTQQDLRHTMERIVIEIRNAGFDPKRSGEFGIEDAGSKRFRFAQDTYDMNLNDYNGVIDEGNKERITYRIDTAGNRLLKIEDEGTSVEKTKVILPNLQSDGCSFQYLDKGGAETADVTDIVSVVINLSLKNNAGWSGDVDRQLRTQAKLRNLGLR